MESPVAPFRYIRSRRSTDDSRQNNHLVRRVLFFDSEC